MLFEAAAIVGTVTSRAGAGLSDVVEELERATICAGDKLRLENRSCWVFVSVGIVEAEAKVMRTSRKVAIS